ncbi:unnamed protein product [Ixodes hexagonus]
MRISSCITAAMALTILTGVEQSNGACDVTPKPGVQPLAYPNVEIYYPKGFKLTAEINNENMKATMFLNEYYSFDTKRGLLEITSGGVLTNVYYSHATEEIFVYNNTACNTLPITSPPNAISPLLLRWWSEIWGKITILGPSTLFLAPSFVSTIKMTYQGTDDVRGIHAKKWATCFNGTDEPYEIDLVDYMWDFGYGTKRHVPLRVRHGKVTIDIMQMQAYINDPERKLKIPMDIGCTRLYKNTPKPPNFDNIPMEFHSEIAFTNPSINGDYHYMSHLDIIKDPINNYFSYSFSPWNTATGKLDKTLAALPEHQVIFDATNGKYLKQTSYLKLPFANTYAPFGRGKCYVSSRVNSRPVIQLPDNSSINVLDTIAPNYDFLQNASYLGIHVIRGAPVHVYEIKTSSVPVGGADLSHVIITYCFLVDLSYPSYINQRNLPVRVSMQAFSNNKSFRSSPYFYFYANIHDISTAMEELNDKMSVMDCYTENDASYTWIQMGFPVVDLHEGFPRYSPQIKSKFMATFLQITSLSPLRVPRVLVDMSNNMVYITSLILERPLIETDFDQKKNFDLKDHELSFAVVTLEECFKICLSADYRECRAVAYCVASCYTSSTNPSNLDDALVKTTNCTAYIKNGLNKRRTLPLTRDALRKVKTAVDESKFKFIVEDSYGDHLVTLIAESFDDSMGSLSRTFRGEDRFGTPHSQRRDGYEIEGFETFAHNRRLAPSADGAVDLGSYSLTDCADICRDRPDCQFFSSCLVDSQCIIGTTPGWTGKSAEVKVQCAIFAKSVKNNFELFDGISLDATSRKNVTAIGVDDCARLCTSEKGFDCKSFDFCGLAKDQNTICRLRDTHIREFGEPSRIKKQQQNFDRCMHYSKKYLYDFKKNASTRVKADGRTVIRQVTPEECAKECRDATFLCENFDHCTGPKNLGRGDCTLYESVDGSGPFQIIFSPICSSYSYRGDVDLRSFSNPAAALHSNGTAGGLAFFMILLGVGLGALAFFAYGYYKNYRLNRV